MTHPASTRPSTAIALRGLSLATPPRISQHALCELALEVSPSLRERAQVVRRIYLSTTVETRGVGGVELIRDAAHQPGGHGASTARRMASFLPVASELAIQAGRAALRDAHVQPGSITHLITASCTGFAAPGVEHALCQALGLHADVQRVHVGFMGCHGAINALRTARGLAGVDPAAQVLVVCAEVCSLHFRPSPTPDQLVANALFADGAAACIVSAARDRDRVLLRATGSTLIPGSGGAMGWTIGDHGFAMSLDKGVPDLVRAHAGPWMTRWLASVGLGVGDVKTWCVHPGGPKVLDAFRDGLGLPEEALAPSRRVLREYGNMSSPTVLAIARDALGPDAGRSGPCVLASFGPGLACEAALLDVVGA